MRLRLDETVPEGVGARSLALKGRFGPIGSPFGAIRSPLGLLCSFTLTQRFRHLWPRWL
jgi:hypothetical protein